MVVEVRRTRSSDEDAVIQLIKQLIRERMPAEQEARAVFRELLAGERGLVLVATLDEAIVGVISVSYNPAMRYGGPYAQIEELIVNEAARGQQAGAALVRAAIAEAQAHGCREMGLYPIRGNEAFYAKFGFAEVGVEMRMPLSREVAK